MYLQSVVESYLILLQDQICVTASATYSVMRRYGWVLWIMFQHKFETSLQTGVTSFSASCDPKKLNFPISTLPEALKALSYSLG